MLRRFFHSTLAVSTALGLLTCTWLQGETSTVKPVVESYKKQEKELSRKRFGTKKQFVTQQSNLTEKKLPLRHWNKQYSSLGSRKWDYSVEKTSDKKRFKAETMDFSKKKNMDLSKWQGYLANLESEARISTDTTARIIQEKRIYEMMLQQAENYEDTGKQLSLREINRFQFRKNRSKDNVPVTKAGVSDETQ